MLGGWRGHGSLLRMLVLFPAILFVIIPIGTLALVLYSLLHAQTRRRRRNKVIAIFHPYCDAGGGGERVLFCAIRSLLLLAGNEEDDDVVVYTGDTASSDEAILQHCLDNFGPGSTPPTPNLRIKFVRLGLRWLVEAETWPRFTLIGQSLGSIVLGMEALFRLPCPDVFLDTMGYAFTFPLAKLCQVGKVACYVHYPTISTDMLSRVVGGGNVKYYYYLAFAGLYRWVGRSADLVMVNSTWTKNHIDSLWRVNSTLVFPPCLSSSSTGVAAAADEKELERDGHVVVSVGQFRPEKNHELQLRAVAAFNNNRNNNNRLKLCMIGSCRHEQDEALVRALRFVAVNELGMREGEDFEFMINCHRQQLEHKLRTSLIGVHSMWNEHFGIGIVEMMHLGLLVVAHNSGGPKSDIISPKEQGGDGLLASTADEYANAFEQICRMTLAEQQAMRDKATQSVQRFTEEGFAKQFASSMVNLT